VIRWRSLSSWDRYPARIAAQQAAGTQADLLEAPVGSLLQQWLSQGITQPLDDLVEAAQLDTSDILGGVLRACRGSLGLAGLPLIGHAGDNILYYNRALLENAGVGLPGPDWVLDDLQTAARLVTRDSDDDGQLDLFGLGLRADLPSAYPALRTFGGRLVSADGRHCEASQPEALAYLRWVASALADEAPFAPRPWQVVRGLYAMFLSGQVAMMRGSLNLAIQVARLGREALQVGSVLFPRRTADAVRGGVATGIAYAIAAGSAVASEVTQWIKLVSSREMGVQMLLGGYAEPGCRKSAWTDKRVLQRFPVASLVAEAADKAEPEELPWNYAMAPCLAAWNDCVGQLVGSDLDPATCAARICSAIDSILDQPMSSIAAP
jgi:multiple sugar transport system substrate-binding protein